MYLLDANVLIEAERSYYSAAIAPPFWEWLIGQNQRGNLASIREVYQEIQKAKEGYLKDVFVKDAPETFWVGQTKGEVSALRKLSDWVENRQTPRFTADAKAEFLQVADYFLVARAKALGATVVTREQSAPRAVKRVLIPDACLALKVPYIEPFKMYEKLGLKFDSTANP